jgi:hypothetical protein
MAQRDSPIRNETAIATANTRHPAQQLGYSGGRIVMGHCVTPRNQGKAILTLPPFNQTMNKEAMVAQDQNDVASSDLVGGNAFNGEQIPRPYRGKHARSPCPELNRALGAKHLGRKTKLRVLASFEHG